MVNAQIMSGPIAAGGKKILDIKARNDAIELMKLKSYLRMDDKRPRWAKMADSLIGQNIPIAHNICDRESIRNTFLQTWTAKTGAKSELPQSLREMLQAAKRHSVDLNPPLPSSSLCNQMPIWFHKGQDENKCPQNNGKWADCQRHQHNIQTVGEMVWYVSETDGIRHFARINCACIP